MHRLRSRTSGLTQMTRGIGTLDAELFDTIARSPSPLLDATMPALSRAADHSKLWMAIAAGLAVSGRPSFQRGAARGLVSLAVTSVVTNQGAKRIRRRSRPTVGSIPVARRGRRQPTSNSLPSGHSASAAAFAAGVAVESPSAGLLLGGLAGLVGLSRVATGAHYPGDVVIGLGIGAAVATIGARVVPPIGRPTIAVADPSVVDLPPRPDGAGVIVVVNPEAADGRGGRVVDEIAAALPAAEIIELPCRSDLLTDDDVGRRTEDDELLVTFTGVAGRAAVLGVAGGDGTVACAAQAAIASDIPLAVFPAGTLNHFARDIGCDTVHATVEAIREGTAVRVDAVWLNDSQLVLNTASVGAYPHFVRLRRRLQRKISRPLATAAALVRVRRQNPHVRVAVDGREIDVSLSLVGNSIYQPTGFLPSRRLRLDDGLLDVRILEARRRWDSVRLLTSLAAGRLERSRLYHEMQVPEFRFTAVDEPVTVAHDGELGRAYTEAHFRVDYRRLKVYGPRRRRR